MGGAASNVLVKDRPDMKGHRAFLVGEVKDRVRGLPVQWHLTKKNFEGFTMSPWGIVTKVNMSEDTGFLEGRKVKVSMGELERVMTDKLVEFSLGGNPQVTGNIFTLNVCLGLLKVNLSKCKAYGELEVFSKCPLLQSLDLGDSKVVGDIAHLSGCTMLSKLVLRWTKCGGELSGLADLPLATLDLCGTQVHGNVAFIATLANTLTEVRLQRSNVSGDVMAFENCEMVEVVDLGRMPHIEGDIGSFELCVALKTLNVTETRVDIDNLGSLSKTLKDCDIRASANTLPLESE
mmetsp:Transcript_75198/g.151170  ORF Transcript_75198/g.151170 Transcript_75198/m.151170 type:complete len:291 (-) Transcript_75198:269-1141(-)|eukprot:CAMPEP_0171721696 /NCGR_PEP_ID=MMETSP0991-20121206/22541_1 /TAXON_ID=483369 /ORGANISM="non described non described, Strain CCMP2098" /LENGTH=290 /DNA_ID=CAMNT_0012313671 /DNA_START=62 /DNA_END=934 /DNA_ORIENTATION=+